MTMKMIEGHFYRALDGDLWCCFETNGDKKRAKCVRKSDFRVAHFDFEGKPINNWVTPAHNDNRLMEDMTVYWESLNPTQQRLTDEIAVLKESNENLRAEVKGLLRKLNPQFEGQDDKVL
jgi:hypothetical protein